MQKNEALMTLNGGDKSNPGHYRKQSVRVGNLIPPPPLQVPDLMTALEQYINVDGGLPALIKAGLAHVQFETIHPFLDGNGRIGRLLIILILIENELLSLPVLYPSYYFKKNRFEYYTRLDNVRTKGDFEGWIKFFLEGIKIAAIDAYQRAQDIEKLEHNLINLINKEKQSSKINQMKKNALLILFKVPVINVKELSLKLDVSYNTAKKVISDFIKLQILVEITHQKRNQLYKFEQYFDILERE